VFFGLLGSHGDHVADFVGAAEYTTLLTAGLVALAFALAFLLPQRARAHEAPPAPAQLDPAFA
jgi:hypothetical protein